MAFGLLGWLSGPHNWSSPAALVAVGLAFSVSGVAEYLPPQQSGAAVVLRTVYGFVMLVFLALVIADVSGYTPV